MNRILRTLILILLLFTLSQPFASADVVIDGVTYFNVVNDVPDNQERFIKRLFLEAEYNKDGHASAPLIDRWGELVKDVPASVDWPDYDDRYAKAFDHPGLVGGFAQGKGYAESLKKADESIRAGVKEKVYKDIQSYPVQPAAALSSEALQPVVYYWSSPVLINATGPWAALDHYYVYAVILSDMEVVPVVTLDTYTSIPQETWRDAYKQKEDQSRFINAYINHNTNPIETKTDLQTTFSESATNSMAASHTKTSSKHFTVGLEVPITKFLPAETKVSGEFGMEWSDTWQDDWAQGKTKTKETQSGVSVSLSLPAHSKVVVEQRTGVGMLDLKYDFPVSVRYKAQLVRYILGSGKESEVLATYDASGARATSDAREDLFKRGTKVVSDPSGIQYSDKAVTLARQLGRYVPMSKNGCNFAYAIESKVSEVYGVLPLYNLSDIKINGADEYVLKVGDALRLDTLNTKGYNAYNVAYHGFSSDKGRWILVDEHLTPITDTSVAEMRINPATKAVSVIANGPGTVYLKYLIDEAAYLKVDSQTEYIKNADLRSTAVIELDVLDNTAGYQVVAQGKVVGSVGDTIDLMLEDGLSAFVLDGTGKAVAAAVKWQAQELSDSGIRVDETGHLMTLSKTGTFHIRATWNNLYSNWVEVTSRAVRVFSAIELTDPNRLFGDWGWADTPRMFDMEQLKARCLDQFGEAMADKALSWYVVAGGAPAASLADGQYTVTKPGTYSFYAMAEGKKSNEIAMRVFQQNALARLTIVDDMAPPLLSDYILGSGTDMFQLDRLGYKAYDSQGKAYELQPSALKWYVNDQPLGMSFNCLTVTEPGIYEIWAFAGSIKSNILKLNVLPAQTLKTLTIADDPLTPMLGEYKLGSGSDRFDLSKLTVTGEDQYGKTVVVPSVNWYANGQSLPDGVLSVSKVGKYEIYAAAKQSGAQVKSNSLTLDVISRVTGFTLNEENLELAAGDTFLLVATPQPLGERDVFSFSSNKPGVASVDASGMIKGELVGQCTITVTSGSGYEKTCRVSVLPAPESIALDPDQLLMGIGDSYKLTPVIKPAGTSAKLSYRSNNPGVVAVDGNGVLSAKAKGETLILVETHNGKRATCYVEVTDEPGEIRVPDKLELGQAEAALLEVELRVSTHPNQIMSSRIAFESLDPGIATVDGEGLVTGVKPGSTKIKLLSYNGLMKLCDIHVYPAPVSVRFEQGTLTIPMGERMTLVPILSDGSFGRVTYQSNKPAIVSVTKSGRIEPLKKGQATVTATTYNGKKAKCTITVIAAPKKITLDRAQAEMGVGETLTLRCMSGKAQIDVSYASGSPGVASVDRESGVVKAVARGRATITATSATGLTASCAITVLSAPNEMVTEPVWQLGLGELTPSRHTFLPEGSGGGVRVLSSNEKVVKITANGIKAVKRGQATLTLTAYNGLSKQVAVEVLKAPKKVTLSDKEIFLTPGMTHTLRASLPAGTAGACVFTSKKSDVATVDPLTGVVSALKNGESVITVKTYNGKSAKCTVYVSIYASESDYQRVPRQLKLPARKSVRLGQTLALKPDIKPDTAAGAPLTWSTDNPLIAAVDKNGVVTGTGVGKAVIEARTDNGLVARCTVTVTSNAVKKVELNKAKKTLAVGERFQLVATPKPLDAVDRTVVWTSSNEQVATVDAQGNVTALAPGKANIVAVSVNGKKGRCVITVK